MNKLLKFLSACMIVCLVVTLFPSVKEAHAAKDGDKKSTTITLTLSDVNTTCNTFEDIINKNSTSTKISSSTIKAACNLKKLNVLGTIVSITLAGVSYIGAIQFKNDYNFYKGIRNTMIDNNYKTVTIRYIQVYRVNRMYGDYAGGWYEYSKNVINYGK